MERDDALDLKKYIVPLPAMAGLKHWLAGSSAKAALEISLRDLVDGLQTQVRESQQYHDNQIASLGSYMDWVGDVPAARRAVYLREAVPFLISMADESLLLDREIGRPEVQQTTDDLQKTAKESREQGNGQMAALAEAALQDLATIDANYSAVAQAFELRAAELSAQLAADEAHLAETGEAARAPMEARPQPDLDLDQVVDAVMRQTTKARAFLAK